MTITLESLMAHFLGVVTAAVTVFIGLGLGVHAARKVRQIRASIVRDILTSPRQWTPLAELNGKFQYGAVHLARWEDYGEIRISLFQVKTDGWYFFNGWEYANTDYVLFEYPGLKLSPPLFDDRDKILCSFQTEEDV